MNKTTLPLALSLLLAAAPAFTSAEGAPQPDARAQMMAQMSPEMRAKMFAQMSPEMREKMLAQMPPEMRAQMQAGLPVPPHAASPATPQDDTLFQALGGKDGIRHVVENLLDLSVHDARIAHTFKDVDMEHLSMRLQEQLCHVSGGPCTYQGKDMKVIHEDMKVTNAQFNALVEDLQTAMDRQGIASRWQNKLLARLAPMQRDVVTR